MKTIEIDDVSKSFGKVKVLQNLTAGFVENTITTILGPSGTGKSVLLKHIVGLLEPDSGSVRVLGHDIWNISEGERFELRKRFGVLFQDGALFGSMDVFDNVAFPLRRHTGKEEDEIEHIVIEKLRDVGLIEARDRAPNEISGGMKKRAGLARALVLEPSAVLFDEPDSGLDPVRTSLLNDLILSTHKERGGTYLVVTHDIETAKKVSDYVGLLWKGSLVHFGPIDDVLASDDPFAAQFMSGSSTGPLGMD